MSGARVTEVSTTSTCPRATHCSDKQRFNNPRGFFPMWQIGTSRMNNNVLGLLGLNGNPWTDHAVSSMRPNLAGHIQGLSQLTPWGTGPDDYPSHFPKLVPAWVSLAPPFFLFRPTPLRMHCCSLGLEDRLYMKTNVPETSLLGCRPLFPLAKLYWISSKHLTHSKAKPWPLSPHPRPTADSKPHPLDTHPNSQNHPFIQHGGLATALLSFSSEPMDFNPEVSKNLAFPSLLLLM